MMPVYELKMGLIGGSSGEMAVRDIALLFIFYPSECPYEANQKFNSKAKSRGRMPQNLVTNISIIQAFEGTQQQPMSNISICVDISREKQQGIRGTQRLQCPTS